MEITCPNNPLHNEFAVAAHVVQDWKVDRNGDYIETLEDCTDVTHRPDSQDYYTCCICGAEAIVRPAF